MFFMTGMVFFTSTENIIQIMKLFLKSDITTKKVSVMVTFCMFMFTIHPESNITDKQISS